MIDSDMLKRVSDALKASGVDAALVDATLQAYAAEQRLGAPLYLAHWATEADFDAEKDDSSFDCIADMASPCGMILRDIEPATIQRLLEHVTADIKAVDEECFPIDALWEQTCMGDHINQWDLQYGDGEVYAVLIVRKEETTL